MTIKLRLCQSRLSLFFVLLLQTMLSFAGFLDLSLWSVLDGAVDSPLHCLPLACCSVSLRHTEQNLKPHFWHWQCPSCVFEKFEGEVHFGHALSWFPACLVTGWCWICDNSGVLVPLFNSSWLFSFGMLRFTFWSGNLARSSYDEDFRESLVPWFSCEKKK